MTHPPFSSLIKHLCPSVWSMSHFKTSIQGKTGALLATMCKYDRQMLGNTWSSSALTPGSLCRIYYGYSYFLIMLKRYPHCGSATLDPMLASVSPNTRGWMKTFFVIFLTISSTLGAYSNFLVVPGEEPSPVFGSLSFGALNEFLVVGFLYDIVSAN
jgi:hypothetical protein